MIQKIVDVLISKQLQNHTMTDEDKKIYRYGYVLLCEVVLNLAIALVIGIFFFENKSSNVFFRYVYSVTELLRRMACG